jgi:hypothetical protein
MADVIEIWADSGQVVERDFTAEEAAQRAADIAAAEAAAAAALAEREAKAAARAALLERLGLSEDEAVLLLGGGS